MSDELPEALKRYFRATAAHPEQRLAHHGDCWFFNVDVCTCGLLHSLENLDTEWVAEKYPKFEAEHTLHERALGKLVDYRRG